jgi:hypothetical protein
MGAVAERLVFRLAAAAEGDPIAGFVAKPVGGLQLDAAACPDRSARFLLRVFQQHDRRVERQLDRLRCTVRGDDESAARAVAALMRDDRTLLSVVGLQHEVPNPAMAVADPRERAQRAIVGQIELRTHAELSIVGERPAARGFGSVEADPRMRAVAEWLFP